MNVPAVQIPLPPEEIQQFVGSGPYDEIGAHVLDLLIEVGGLQMSDDVLDVGCGNGRVARHLAGYLDEGSRYEGFDPWETGVRWCQENITPARPTFTFQHVDLANTYYNRRGSEEPADFRFPYDDASFDFAFLTSVFTHMLPPRVRNYLGELHRVLRPGGTCFSTWYLLNARSRAALETDAATVRFPHERGACRTANSRRPEAVIAYPQTWAFGATRSAGFTVAVVRYGQWANRPRALTTQDIIVARV